MHPFLCGGTVMESTDSHRPGRHPGGGVRRRREFRSTSTPRIIILCRGQAGHVGQCGPCQ